MSIFDEQIARKPDKYPWTKDFIDSMWNGFWTANKYSFQSDLHDFKTRMTPQEQEIVVKTLSAIGQIEIAVKKFWSKIGDVLPHPSIVDLGLVMANVECYADDTEILTPKGWILIKDMEIGDEVYQYKDGILEQTNIRNTIRKYYEGKMYSFGDKSNHCLVTPNHEMLIQRKRKDEWESCKVLAKDFKFHPCIKLPWTVKYNGGTVNHLSPLEKLKIAVQADGTIGLQYNKNEICHKGRNGGFTHCIRIKKQRKIDRLMKIIDDCGINFSKTNNSNGTTQILVRLEYGNTYKNFADWVDLSNKTANWCKEFIQELIYWDGNCKNHYFSARKAEVDFCQIVAVLAGYNSTVGYTPDYRPNCSTKYRVSFITKENKWRHVIGLAHKIEDYKGYVSCVTVDSGVIVTRRNGRTFIAGNCIHNNAYEKLLDVLDLNEIFQKNLSENVIVGRVKYLRKYLSKEYVDDKKQFLYALILFTLFVENVSLFSQFYIIAWFNRYKGSILKDASQQILFTSREEFVHFQCGAKIINTIREEFPELFDAALESKIYEEAKCAYEAECKLVDWMLGDYKSERINSDILKSYIKYRLNSSLVAIGFSKIFEVDDSSIRDFEWFDEEVNGNVFTDFFVRNPVNYEKSSKPIDEGSLFDE